MLNINNKQTIKIKSGEPPFPPIPYPYGEDNNNYVWYNPSNYNLGYVFDRMTNSWVAPGPNNTYFHQIKSKKNIGTVMNSNISKEKAIQTLKDIFDSGNTADENILEITTMCLDFIVQDVFADYDILNDYQELVTTQPTPDIKLKIIFYDRTEEIVTFSYNNDPENDYDAAFKRGMGVFF